MNAAQYLGKRWEKTLQVLRVPSAPATTAMISEILHQYAEPGRAYHNLEHLRFCFTVIDDVMAKLPGIGAVELALWYHDFFYDTHAQDNEERSAAHARDQLIGSGFGRGFANQVENLILATKHSNEPKTREAKVLLDVDISIFSATTEEYDAYETGIRREYHWVPEEQFRARRVEVLERFLSRQWIYATPEFRSGPYETLARANLTRAIAALKAP